MVRLLAATITWGSLNGVAVANGATAANGTIANVVGNGTDEAAAQWTGSNTVTGFFHDWTFNVTPDLHVLSINVDNPINFITRAWLNGIEIFRVGGRFTGSILALEANNPHLLRLELGAYTGSNKQYNVTLATPIPAAIWLFGSALLGLVGASRRKASANGLNA